MRTTHDEPPDGFDPSRAKQVTATAALEDLAARYQSATEWAAYWGEVSGTVHDQIVRALKPGPHGVVVRRRKGSGVMTVHPESAGSGYRVVVHL